jgi:hypothetical protein
MAYITYRDTLRRTPVGESTLQTATPDRAATRSGLFTAQKWDAPLAVLETVMVVATLGFFGLMLDNTIAGIF